MTKTMLSMEEYILLLERGDNKRCVPDTADRREPL